MLRAVEEALATLALEEAGRGISSPRSAPSFQIDPFRVKIGIRTGIAVCAAFLVTLVLGWNINTMVAPMAFMAAAFTRGGAARGLVGLAGIVLFAWLVADLALVYFTPHVNRMPVVLVYSFVVAGAFAYVRVLRPQLAMLPSVGGLLAILPVYSGLSAQTDVYGTYNTVCYVAMGLGIGWIASRVFWPSTAAGLFRDRIAVQLELCLDSFRRAGSSGRAERAREALRVYEVQLVQLGSLHAEADYEPVELGLDGSRRAALLALTRDLFDAVAGARRVASAAVAPLWQRAGAAFLPLREALEREEEALVAGMQANVAALRGAAEEPSSRLAEAHQAVRDRLAELRASAAHTLDVGADTRRELLIRLDSHRQVVTRQLAVEAWLADSGRQAPSAS